MMNEKLKSRLRKDRPMTSITLRIPEDVVAEMKEIAPRLGFSAYQTLLKRYISEGLRRDEEQLLNGPAQRLAKSLKKRGVPDKVLEAALAEVLIAA